MRKASIGGCLAVACSFIFVSTGARAQVQCVGWPDSSPVQGDIFESGSGSPRAYPPPPKEAGDIFAAGTDEYNRNPDQIYATYNNDPLDPFYFAVPRTIVNEDIFDNYALAHALNSIQPALVGRTNGTIGPQGTDSFIIDDNIFGSGAGQVLKNGGNTLSQSNCSDSSGGDIFSSGQRNKHVHTARPATPAAPTQLTWVWKNNPTEPRWEPYRLPLRVYISGTVEAARGGLVRETIKSALHQWSQASNGIIRYQITTKYCDADIHFVEQLTDDHELAQACVDYHKGPIDHAKVIFLTSTLKSLPESRLKGLCLHEIGHVFGILKHSPNARDAMSGVATDDDHPVTILSEKDKHVMAALYERRGVPIKAPHPSLSVASAFTGNVSMQSGRANGTQ